MRTRRSRPFCPLLSCGASAPPTRKSASTSPIDSAATCRLPIRMTDSNFYWRHLRLPLIVFALLAPLLATSYADIDIAHALFFDEVHSQWIGADSWWTNDLIHHGGALLIRC